MSEINYQALREAAERAIPAMERLLMLPADDDLLSEQELKDYGVDIDALNAFKFLAGPETVLALLDERERNQQYIKLRDQENEDIALTVGKLRVELEHYKSREERVTKLVLDNSTSWDALYKKLEAAERRIAEMDRDCWTYENTVKTLLERAGSAESACAEAARILKSGERMALSRAVNILLAVGEDAAPYRYPVVLPEPLGFKPPSGRDVLLKNDVIAALMSAGVPVERG
ncbi:ead/Ea22-like family protein [Salmonella enterica]|nr:ead/Ea22-like family protein [Salmonella enterica]ECJ0800066.1 ead/Ea22-like family protein [Salmonella enterica]